MKLFNFGNDDTKEAPEDPKDTDTTTDTTKDTPTGLDKFSFLIQNGGKGEGEGDDQPVDPLELIENPEVLRTLQQQVNFSQAVSDETLQKLQDPETMQQGMVEAMEQISKAAYITALQHAAKIASVHTENKLSSTQEQLLNATQERIGEYDLIREIPELQNPIVKQAVKPFVQSFKQANPDASSRDIGEAVKEFIGELASTFGAAPPNSSTTKSKDDGAMDWEEFLNN